MANKRTENVNICAIDTNLIMKLEAMPADVLYIIFDFLCLRDLNRIGSQSNVLDGIVRNYNKSRFKGQTFAISTLGNQINHSRCGLCFLNELQNITIYGCNMRVFRYVGVEHKIKPIKISFKSLSPLENYSSAELENCLKETMQNVQRVAFCVFQFCDRLLNDLLCMAKNMRELIIESEAMRFKTYKNADIYWWKERYPYLQTIQWDDGITNKTHEFGILLKQNKNIQNLKISGNILMALEFIGKENLSLDKLTLNINSKDIKNMRLICDRLNRLLQSKHYKRLYLKFSIERILTDYIEDITTLNGLVSIHYSNKYHRSINRLKKLREMFVASMENGNDISQQLQKLEKLHVNVASMESIIPFIRNCSYLREIVIKRVHQLDGIARPSINYIIEQREQLIEAKPVDLYVPEWAYVHLKMYSETPTQINVKRIESFLTDI